MRARGTVVETKPLRSTRRREGSIATAVGRSGGVERRRAWGQPELPAAPLRSTFRRVAVFVPLSEIAETADR